MVLGLTRNLANNLDYCLADSKTITNFALDNRGGPLRKGKTNIEHFSGRRDALLFSPILQPNCPSTSLWNSDVIVKTRT